MAKKGMKRPGNPNGETQQTPVSGPQNAAQEGQKTRTKPNQTY